MNVKVQCPCGTKFSFDVEPVNGRMPLNVNCPGCNQSALDLANAQIKLQLEAAAGAPAPSSAAKPAAEASHQPKIHVSLRSASPAPAPAAVQLPQPERTAAPTPPAPSLRISKPAAHSAAPTPAPTIASPPSAAPAEEPPVPVPVPEQTNCPRHKKEPAVDTCRVCGKPICLKCMEQFGYVCSVYCRSKASSTGVDVPVYANQKALKEGRAWAKAGRITYAAIAALALFVGIRIWYAWFARTPKVVYSVTLPKTVDQRTGETRRPAAYFRLIGPGLLLSVQDKQLALTDVTGPKQLWSARLQTQAEADAIKAAKDNNERIMKATPKVRDPESDADITRYRGLDPLAYENDYAYYNPHIAATTNDIWVALPEKLIRFDRQTGSRKESGIKGKITYINFSDGALFVIASETKENLTLNRITLPEGSIQSEELYAAEAAPLAVKTTNKVAVAGPAKPASKSVTAAAVKLATPQPAAADTSDGVLDWEVFAGGSIGRQFIVAGPNVAEFQTKLLESKTIAHEAMKPKPKSSIMEGGNLTAGQSMEATQEMLNDMRRDQSGGVVQEDVSRYQVTLKRRFTSGAPDWTGEVNGPPHFFPFKTVDAVAAGNSLLVFSKANKKLWDAKLTFAVVAFYGADGLASPGLETKDALYFADQGMLTRFDLGTGNPRWRLNSVGIRGLVADDRGNLYVSTSTAGPESIRYSEQINLHDKIHPVILKVDAATGKVLWRDESIADEVRLSGRFVYATRVSQSQAMLRLEEGPDTHFNLDLLDPGNGHMIWNYYQQNRNVLRTDVMERWSMVQFYDGVVVLKFFSL